MNSLSIKKTSKLLLSRISTSKDSSDSLPSLEYLDSPSLSTSESDRKSSQHSVSPKRFPSLKIEKSSIFKENHTTEVFPSGLLAKYSVIEEIGKGMQAFVYKVRENSTQEIFAAKIYRFASEEHLFNIIREADILSQLSHENIIKFKEFIADDFHSCYALITEFFVAADIKAFLATDPLPQNTRIIIDQLINSIQYLHQNSVSHGDLNPGNILIDEKSLKAKIIDFGLSKSNLCSIQMSPSQGHNEFRPPKEVFLEQENSFGGDEWASGLILLSLLTGNIIKTKKAVCMIKRRNEQTGEIGSVLKQMKNLMEKGKGWDWDSLKEDLNL